MKFVIMAFDAGTELSEHAAPGEALIFVLDGEGVIGYEGKEHPIKAGENFRFAKAGIHSVKAAKLALGDIGGIPRVLDAGQCNDSYSLALIALKLKEVFGLDDINDLPIAFNIAWYEQKAVIVLLALLYLGVKNIHLGPTLPGFLSPNVAKVLVENFGIAGIGTVDEDLKLLVGETA